MESLIEEAVACVRGEEKAGTLLESIRSQTDDSAWLEYAATLQQQAIVDYQTRAVEVDLRIEAMDLLTGPPFISLSMLTLEALEGNIQWLLTTTDKQYRFREATQIGDVGLVSICIQAGVDPSIHDNWAIRMASENGHYLVVDRLLQDSRCLLYTSPSPRD